ncbi:ulp1 protease family, C-terminal catalytic domain-containing protein [Tanacetum coccineum]
MEVDTPYRVIDQNSVKGQFQPKRLARVHLLVNLFTKPKAISDIIVKPEVHPSTDLAGFGVDVDMAYPMYGYGVLRFLGVWTTFDIFLNIHLLYFQYGVLVFSGYGVLIMWSSWSDTHTKKGWLSDDHLDIRIEYLWQFKQPNDDWAMTSPYLSDMLLRYEYPLYYADGVKYGVPWFAKSVKKVLGELDITSGVITFYDSLGGPPDGVETHHFLLEVRQKLEFQFLLYLDSTEVFEKKEIDKACYSISFRYAKGVPLQGGLYGDCGLWVCIFLYSLSHNIPLEVDDSSIVALAWRERIIDFYWRYKILQDEIIAINLDTSSDNSSSDSNNNTSDSASTSQISTSEEIDYDSLEYKGPPKSLLKWYGYLSDEYKDNGRFWGSKPSFLDITKAKACMLAKAQASDASSKAKVQACGSKAKLQTSYIDYQLKYIACQDFAKVTILNFPFVEIIVLSSDSSDDRKGSSKASIPIFKGPSVEGLLDHYGYNDIEKYLSWNYFPSTDKENTNKDITDKDITDEDCIHESNYAMSKGKYVPVLHKLNPKVKSPVLVTGCVLGLTNVTTWDEIVNKFLLKIKPAIAASICSLHLHFAFASCICSMHLQLAFVACICSLHLQLAFAAYICS